MRFSVLLLSLLSLTVAEPLGRRGKPGYSYGHGEHKITPKVFLISMFEPEAAAWWGIDEFDLLAKNVTVPGFSPLYPDAHCTANGDVCQIIIGESGECLSDLLGGRSLTAYQKSTLPPQSWL